MSKELLKEFEEKFEEMKKELGFKATLEELDGVFFYKDLVLHYGFVSPDLSRVLCSRMVETFNSWTNFFHSMIMPNPASMINTEESKLFDEKEKNEMMLIMKKFLKITSKNAIIGILKDKKEEGKFFDEALRTWQENKETLIKNYQKINTHWDRESQT